MGIHANAGTQVGIGTTTAFTSSADYATDDFVPIHNITDAGEAGSEAEIITSKHVDTGYVRKLKGSRDAGNMVLVVDRDASDPGYRALIAAEKTPHAYNFRVTLNDAPASGANPKPSTFYFAAIVASAKNGFNDSDSVVNTRFTLAITTAIVEVPASAA